MPVNATLPKDASHITSITTSLINTSLERRHALAAAKGANLEGRARGAVVRVFLQPMMGANGGNDSGM